MPISFRRSLDGPPPRRLYRVLEDANEHDRELNRLTDEQLRLLSPTNDLAQRLARARIAAVRTIGERPHDEQMLGAAALASGYAIEMLTGEGKTLAAALAAYALVPEGPVHIATANDYLAGRDPAWMRPLYEYLGLTVGVTGPTMSRTEKQAAYACDVTYATARELAFDYLRDTLTAGARIQRGHSTALVDEIDFILLDEARIPFVLTKREPVDPEGLAGAAHIVAGLQPAVDFEVDDAQRTAWLTERGIERVEESIGAGAMSDPNAHSGANVHMALRARCSVRRDRDYVVVGGRVQIVDEFTGRVLPGRRWTDGMHQAVEAKEGVPIREDSRPLAQITVRSYFSRYETLVGMSGTALAAHMEFHDTYGVNVVAIPSHRPVIRVDMPDRVYAAAEKKYDAVVDEVVARHRTGQPLLIGTTTVAHSEYLSARLRGLDVEHQVLNAKHHATEAAIIAEAGRVGAVTVATNMAGRGVDIKLGGTDQSEHEAVVRLGGLCVIGTERHASSRVDDQLRGRAGRQGDPGESVFFASLEDDIVVTQGPGIPHRPQRAVDVAQRNNETRDLELRATSHEYDEILDGQYAELCRFRDRVVTAPGFDGWSREVFERRISEGSLDAAVDARWAEQRLRTGAYWEQVQRLMMYSVTEEGWTRVLETMHGLRNWVNLVAFGGNFPITEWRRRSDAAVAEMQEATEVDYLTRLLTVDIVPGPKPEPAPIEPPPFIDSPPPVEDAQLPETAIHPQDQRFSFDLDWLKGFAGPEFEEVIVVVDPSGGELDDVALSEDGLTVYIPAGA
ncbi:MAG: preprotein translocase subunit SecA [Acidimicrobiia bacterium]